MKYRKLGSTGIDLSVIGMGTWAIGGKDWGPSDDEESVAALEAAMDSGLTFMDTADAYGDGHSEELLGRALKGRRNRLVLASKGGLLPGMSRQDFSARHLRRALEGSLRRLGTEALDLYYLHNPSQDDMRRGECFEAMEGFLREGKIRAWGVSVRPPASGWFTPLSGDSPDPVADARLALELASPHAIQIVFNLVEHQALSLFAQAAAKGAAIIARVPLAQGLLAGKFTAATRFPEGDFRRAWPRDRFLQDLETVERIRAIVEPGGYTMLEAALAFPIAFDAVAATIPSARNPRQARANALVGARDCMDPAIRDAILQLGESAASSDAATG